MINLPERPHHIAFYLPSLGGGGAERVMVILANGFAACGYRVDLVVARADGPYLTEVSTDVRVVDLNSHKVLASLPRLVAYLRRERPKAMLSALNHANVVAIVARALSRIRCRLIVSEHSSPSRALAGPGKPRIMARLIRTFYPWADIVVCVSEGIRQEMRHLLRCPDQKLVTIYNPLDLNVIRRMAQEPALYTWPAGVEGPLILAAGRLTEAKDYPTLLKAFAVLSTAREARLMILGQGELEGALKALCQDLGIADRVAFMGFQTNPFAWMRAADLYVLSSQREGLPGTLMEAMACGAKIVSTDCRTGPDEILQNGKWGRLVAVGDHKALACAIQEALDETNPPDPTVRAEDFNIHRAINQYACVMVNIC